jgi:hypothetical protein
MRLLFPFDEVMELVAWNKDHNQAPTYVFPGEKRPTREQLNKNRALHLVGDQGVYLMAGTVENMPAKEGAKDGNHVLYALGCNPHTDPEFYDNKILAFGGDDGVEQIPVAEILYLEIEILKTGRTTADYYFSILLTEKTMEIGAKPRKGARKGRR